MNKLLKAGLVLALPISLAAAFAPVGTAIRFAPEEGLSLTKTYEQKSMATLESILFRMGEEELDIEEIPEISIRSSEMIVFEDTYDSVEGGRATRLTRSFQELGRERTESYPDENGSITDTDTEETSGLADTVVVFSWDDDEEQYTVVFHEDSEGDEDLLEDLFGDADLLGFLPDGEVEVGDTWEPDVEAFKRLLSPGGDLVFLDDEGESSADEIDEEIDESLDGEIECELESIEDGIATITVTMELEGSGDIETDMDGDGEMIESGVQLREVSIDSEYEGTLTWNLRAGHMVAFSLVGETEVSILEQVTLQIANGEEFEQAQTMIFSSETEIEYSAE
ncbi:MAG: hypothetical protein P1V81_10465 [Planctomycetota bacterium]|nr:hypothetical protein [Planctomycetota bacterium]